MLNNPMIYAKIRGKELDILHTNHIINIMLYQWGLIGALQCINLHLNEG